MISVKMGVRHSEAAPISYACFKVKNESSKEIKYITLYLVPYDRVGSYVIDPLTGLGETSVRITGPIRSHASTDWYKNSGWYDPSITKVGVTKAYIEYMDYSKETIYGRDIEVTAPGCYVATAVYGSYDCPQVWTLRRFRDDTLADTWYGRIFIRTYYAISPTLVKWFGSKTWFKNIWKPILDRMVKRLNNKGVESTPYDDPKW